METFGAIAFVLALAAVTISWIAGQDQGGQQTQSAADPCDDCLRWPECNGIDAEFCEVRRGRAK